MKNIDKSLRAQSSTYNVHLEAVLVVENALRLALIRHLTVKGLVRIATESAGAATPLLRAVELHTVQGGSLGHTVLQLANGIRYNLGWKPEDIVFSWLNHGLNINSYLVQREGDVRIDAKHFPHGILEGIRVHVAIEDVLQHVQEGGIVVLHLDIRLGL